MIFRPSKKNKNLLVTLVIIILIIGISLLILIKKPVDTDTEIVKCIGSKAILYTQLGCHACESQEQLFGENYQYLNIVDCWDDHQPCIDKNITATPTWVINGEKIIGVQTIDKLRELTGC